MGLFRFVGGMAVRIDEKSTSDFEERSSGHACC